MRKRLTDHEVYLESKRTLQKASSDWDTRYLEYLQEGSNSMLLKSSLTVFVEAAAKVLAWERKKYHEEMAKQDGSQENIYEENWYNE